MGVSKVVLGEETLVDLTSDSVNEENLLEGATAHGADGEPVKGTVEIKPKTLTTTKTGEQIHLVDSTDNKTVKFALFGKATQNTTSGKNLYDRNKDSNRTNVGVTATISDGVLILNGTATGSGALPITGVENIVDANVGDVLTFSAKILDGTATIQSNTVLSFVRCMSENNVELAKPVNTTNNGGTIDKSTVIEHKTFTVTEDMLGSDGKLRISIQTYIRTNDVYNNLKLAVQLEKGTVATEYEPYTNGASPNPSYPQEIEVSGESYNLLPYPYYEITKETNGITFTVNENDGSIVVNGTATDLTIMFIRASTSGNFGLENGKEYILSGCPSGGSSSTYKLDIQNQTTALGVDYGSGANFTYDEQNGGEIGQIRIVIYAGTKVENLVFKPMIRKASVKNDRYMPYGKGSVEVKSVGKNLITYPYYKNKSGTGITWTDDNGIITANGTASGNNVRALNPRIRSLFDGSEIILKKGTYTISDGLSNGSGTTYHLAINCYENGNDETSPQKTLATTYTNGTNTFEITEDDKLVWCYITIRDGYVANNLTFYPMIRLATDTDDTWQPYREPSISTIPTPSGLAGIKVDNGGNYTDSNGQQWICDEIVKYADGSGEYVQRIGKAVFDGVTNKANAIGTGQTNGTSFSSGKNYNTLLKTLVLKTGNQIDIISDYFISKVIYYNPKTTDKGAAIYRTPTNIWFSIGITLLERIGLNTTPTVADFNTWLQENPVTVYGVLAEPVVTPLTAEQLAEIEKLSTFYPVTNISNDADCGMNVEYVLEKVITTQAPIPVIPSAEIEELKSGDTTLTLFGKIKKWLTSIKPHAFLNPVNNLLATVSGSALDAMQGKVLDDKINVLNESLGGFQFKTVDGEKQVSTDGGSTWENFNNGVELLWTNPTPNQKFPVGTTVNVDFKNYKYALIVIKEHYDIDTNKSKVASCMAVGESKSFHPACFTNARTVEFTTTKTSFSKTAQSNHTSNDEYGVPTFVYGLNSYIDIGIFE